MTATLELSNGVRNVRWYRDDALVAHTRPTNRKGGDRLVICTGIGKNPTQVDAVLGEGEFRIRDFTLLSSRSLLVAVLSPAEDPKVMSTIRQGEARVVVYDIAAHRVVRELVSGHVQVDRNFPDEQWRVRPCQKETQLLVSGKFFGPQKQSAIAVYDVGTWEQLRVLKSVGENRELEPSPDGRLVAAAVFLGAKRKAKDLTESCGIRIWDVGQNKVVSERTLGIGWIRSLSFSFNAKHLCAVFYVWDGAPGGRDHLRSGLQLWNADQNAWSTVRPEVFGVNYGSVQGKGWIGSASFSPSKNELATGLAVPERLVVRDITSQGSVIDSGMGKRDLVLERVVYSPDGRMVATVPQYHGIAISREYGETDTQDLKVTPVVMLWELDAAATPEQPPDRSKSR